MEKLQQALEKARQKRAGTQSAYTEARAAARQSDPKTSELWAALSPFSPDFEELERNRIVAFEASREAVPFDILRTKVMLTMRKNGWRRLAITSPTANCGKSTTSCNIALGLSRQSDATGILFEFDLRKPVMSER
ncbi:MAG: chromosome partitioning ATPase-like protein, partial [Pseudomonadota bacterium]